LEGTYLILIRHVLSVSKIITSGMFCQGLLVEKLRIGLNLPRAQHNLRGTSGFNEMKSQYVTDEVDDINDDINARL